MPVREQVRLYQDEYTPVVNEILQTIRYIAGQAEQKRAREESRNLQMTKIIAGMISSGRVTGNRLNDALDKLELYRDDVTTGFVDTIISEAKHLDEISKIKENFTLGLRKLREDAEKQSKRVIEGKAVDSGGLDKAFEGLSNIYHDNILYFSNSEQERTKNVFKEVGTITSALNLFGGTDDPEKEGWQPKAQSPGGRGYSRAALNRAKIGDWKSVIDLLDKATVSEVEYARKQVEDVGELPPEEKRAYGVAWYEYKQLKDWIEKNADYDPRIIAQKKADLEYYTNILRESGVEFAPKIKPPPPVIEGKAGLKDIKRAMKIGSRMLLGKQASPSKPTTKLSREERFKQLAEEDTTRNATDIYEILYKEGY